MRIYFLVFALFLPLTASCGGCGGDPPGGDGRSRRTDASFGVFDDGRVVAPDTATTTPCGDLGERCCDSGGREACGDDLTCDPGHDICARGPGDPCRRSADCITGLGCDPEVDRCVSPEGGPCEDETVCVEGTICSEEGTCFRPEGECGTEENECCSRDSCRSRQLVCDNADVCRPCGVDEGPCCDGRRPCGDSDDLLCSRGTCVEPRGCGTPGDDCCAPDDACVFGAECRDGLCIDADDPAMNPDCGDVDQRCCRNSTCEGGAICEPLLTESCVSIGDIIDFVGDLVEDCGELGEICCPFETSTFSFFTCEGDLQCDFFFCSDSCTPLSGDCDSSDDCCQGTDTLCKRTPTDRRCCHPEGGTCENSTDCCGRMTCGDDDTCECVGPGGDCNESSECCDVEDTDGTMVEQRCNQGQCEPVVECTKKVQEQCSTDGGDSQCCGSVCGRRPGDGTPHCCVPKGTSCQGNPDCCGHMECEESGAGGTCVCQAEEELCFRDEECCDGLGCVAGECVPVNDCKRVTARCEANSECCGVLRCENRTASTKTCCGRVSDPCRDSDECCGAMTCDQETGRCRARELGETCVASAAECSGIAICCDGFCRTADHPDC